MPNQTTSFPSWENPMGTDGFEFIEYAAPDPVALGALFEQMGFAAVAKHRSKNVVLYRQGDINFIINGDPDSFAQSFAQLHGPSICAIAFRVKDAAIAYKQAVTLGAWGMPGQAGVMEVNIPALQGIGDSLLYLVDRYGDWSIYDIDFVPLPGVAQKPSGAGLIRVDHVTHHVHRSRIQEWADFYEHLFNFRKVLDFEDELTGLKSRVMTSPCGKIRILLNASSEDSSESPEDLDASRDEGITQVALATLDIFAAVEALRRQGVEFQDTPDRYYDTMDRRLPGNSELLERLRRQRILIDAASTEDGGLGLRSLTKPVIGSLVFEIIQHQ